MYTIFASILAVCIINAHCSPIDWSSATSTTSSSSSQLKLVVKNTSDATNYHLAPIFTELENMEEEVEDDIKAILPYINFLFNTLLGDFTDEDDECSDEMVIQLVPDPAEVEEYKKGHKSKHNNPKKSAVKNKKTPQEVSKSKVKSKDVPHIDNKAVDDTPNIKDISSNSQTIDGKIPLESAKTEDKSSQDTSQVKYVIQDASDSSKDLGDTAKIEKSSQDASEKLGKVLLEKTNTEEKSLGDTSKVEYIIHDAPGSVGETLKVEEKSIKGALETPKTEEKSSQDTTKVEYIVHDIAEAKDKAPLGQPKVDQVK